MTLQCLRQLCGGLLGLGDNGNRHLPQVAEWADGSNDASRWLGLSVFGMRRWCSTEQGR